MLGHKLALAVRATLLLEQGDPRAAVEAAERFLRSVPDGSLERAPALEVLVRAKVALGDQDACGVKYLRYWVNEPVGKVFCLVEAPDADAAHTVHREAHGLVADEIFEFREGV